MIEKIVNFIESGFWQAILFIVIVGIFFAIYIGIARYIFRDDKFENTPLIRRIINNIIFWGPYIASFFIVWRIRHGIGWLIFGIISIICFIFSVVGNIYANKISNGSSR